MPNNRVPEWKRPAAEAAGNGHRYDNLPPVPTSDALGDPSPHLDPFELDTWHWAVRTWWWLTEADRPVLEMICKLRTKEIAGTIFATERPHYIALLKSVGATPADRAKVELPKSPDETEQNKAEKRFL